MIRSVLIILISIFFYTCKESIPEGVIKPAKMQEVLWDLTRADALSQQIVRYDSSRILSNENIELINKVFLIHNITHKEFEKSYSYYTQQPVVFKTMLDSLNAQQIRAGTMESLLKRKRLPADSAKK